MPSSDVLLSVCIPTFNRRAFLAECMESVFAAADRCERGVVEVVVSDNASTDGTSEVLKAAQQRRDIRIIRQPLNIGPHANFRSVAEIARGEYVWIFGDDDLMEADAVKIVVERIRSGADAVICNTALYSSDMQLVVKPRFIPIEADVEIVDADQAMALAGGHMGYISGVVLKRESFLQVSPEAYLSFSNDGTCFMFAALSVLLSCRRIQVVAAPVVRNRGRALHDEHQGAEEARSWNRVFAHGFPRTLRAMAAFGYGTSAIRRAQNSIILDYLLPRLLQLKERGNGTALLIRDALPYLGLRLTFWILLLPLAMLPAFVLLRLRRAKGAVADRLR